jgi:4-hydroxybenzoate polyprenyltransferase
MQNIWKKIKGVYSLVRFDHILITLLSIVITSIYLAREIPPIPVIVLPLLVQAVVFVMNDILDYKTDLINKRLDRPLVSNIISKHFATNLAFFLSFISIILLLFVPLNIAIFVILFFLLSVAYNRWLKDKLLLGNIAIGLTMTAPFLYVSLYFDKITLFLKVFIIAVFIFGIARELLKSAQDMEGDKLIRHSNTYPIVYGLDSTIELINILLSSYIFILFVLILLSESLLSKIILGALIVLSFKISFDLVFKEFRLISESIRKGTLYVMFIGIISILTEAYFVNI